MLVENEHSHLTERIIGCATRVQCELGIGFPELLYQRGLGVEMTEAGLTFQGEVSLPVYYKATQIETCRDDFLVE